MSELYHMIVLNNKLSTYYRPLKSKDNQSNPYYWYLHRCNDISIVYNSSCGRPQGGWTWSSPGTVAKGSVRQRSIVLHIANRNGSGKTMLCGSVTAWQSISDLCKPGFWGTQGKGSSKAAKCYGGKYWSLALVMPLSYCNS